MDAFAVAIQKKDTEKFTLTTYSKLSKSKIYSKYITWEINIHDNV